MSFTNRGKFALIATVGVVTCFYLLMTVSLTAEKEKLSPFSEPPKVTVIVSSWRSGSTFVADLVSSAPSSFYFYEPFEFAFEQRKSEIGSLELLRKLHLCNFTETRVKLWHMNSELQDMRPNPPNDTKMFTPKPQVIGDFCRKRQKQVMKVLRKSPQFFEGILNSIPEADVRGFYLVRDPRGSWNSRRDHEWCQSVADCIEPARMCQTMTAGYFEAQELIRKYPQKFTVVRFEDISLQTLAQTERLFQFLGLPLEEATREFISSHTIQDEGDFYSTFRKSSDVPVRWLRELDFENITAVQDVCEEAMRLWGYKKLDTEEELDKDFNPILSFEI